MATCKNCGAIAEVCRNSRGICCWECSHLVKEIISTNPKPKEVV